MKSARLVLKWKSYAHIVGSVCFNLFNPHFCVLKNADLANGEKLATYFFDQDDAKYILCLVESARLGLKWKSDAYIAD